MSTASATENRPLRWSTELPARNFLGPVLRVVWLLGLIGMVCGCQGLTYTAPNGEQFTRFCFGTTTAVGSLAVEADTNGVRRVELKNYQNDATQALGIVTEAAVRGALQGAK